MYRGVGEHQADFSVTGGNGGRNQAAAVVRFRREHDGVRRRREGGQSCVRQMSERSGGGRVGAHHGQRFFAAPFAAPQSLNGRVVSGITHQVKSSEPFDGYDLSGTNETPGFRDWVTRKRATLCIGESEFRAAPRARIRLRMKTPVSGIVVFSSAGRTHRESCH